MTEPAAPPLIPETPKSKGLAIASLICAFFCAPLGLVLGIISLVKKDQDGKGMAIAGVVLGGLFTVIGGIGILAALLLPAVQKAKQTAQSHRNVAVQALRMEECKERLAKVGRALRRSDKAEVDRLLTASAGSCQIVLVEMNPRFDHSGALVAYCQGHPFQAQKIVPCLFGDGTVSLLTETDFKEALAAVMNPGP